MNAYEMGIAMERSTKINPVQSIMPEVQEGFDFWNSLPSLIHHRSYSGAGYSARSFLRTALQKYLLADIKKAMQLYSDMFSDEYSRAYYGMKPYHVGLDEFFKFNDFTKRFMVEKKINLGIKSWFDVFHSGDYSKWLSERHKPKNIELYKFLIQEWGKRVLRDDKYVPNMKAESSFAKTTNWILDFYQSHESKFILPETIFQLASDLISAITTQFPNGPVYPGHLHSDFIITSAFPQYLVRQAIMQSFDEMVI